MSDLLDKLNNLEHNLDLLSKKIDSTNLENTLLKNQQTKLVSEKSDLIKKNETAKSELKSLLERIDNIKVLKKVCPMTHLLEAIIQKKIQTIILKINNLICLKLVG